MLKQFEKRRNVIIAVVLLMLVASTSPAIAEVTYFNETQHVYLDIPNTNLECSRYITASSTHTSGYTLTEVKVSWEIKSGDVVKMRFFDENAEELQPVVITPTNLSVREYSIVPPTGACTGQICLISGSAEGDRHAWIKRFFNNYGDEGVLLDPDIQEEPPNDPPSSGTDLTEVISGINEVKGAINGMSSGVITEFQGVRNQLDSLGAEVTNIKSAVDDLAYDINQQFSEVISQLDTISSNVQVIKGDVATVKNYLTTPRSPSPLQVNPLPQPSVDSSVPDLTEPYQTPYTYDRGETTMPTAEFGPEPLPFAPDPVAMPHDEPLLAEDPTVLDNPVPRDNPRATDPVIKEEPRQMDSVNIDPPRMVDTSITRQNPFGMDAPLTPQTPLTPTPPLTPGG